MHVVSEDYRRSVHNTVPANAFNIERIGISKIQVESFLGRNRRRALRFSSHEKGGGDATRVDGPRTLGECKHGSGGV
jgi:hypothetical protein